MQRIRSAIVGAGKIGAVHARAIRAAGGEVVAVTRTSPTVAEQTAHRLGAERWSTSYEQVITAPDVDVVHICTPNDVHVEIAAAALAAGKHVICEKPIATDLDGATRLSHAARQALSTAGIVAAVPFVYRFYPTVREARERVHRGDVGTIRLIHGAYLQDWLSTSSDWDWRVDATRGGSSRAFADIGVHWCDLAEFTSGHTITAVHATTTRVHDTRGDGTPVDTEDAAVLTFRTTAGALGCATISQISAGYKNRLTFSLDGDSQSVAFDQERPDSLWLGGRDATTILPRAGGASTVEARRLDLVPAGHPQGYQDCFTLFVADVYDAVRGGTPDGLPTFADGRRAAAITTAVLASAESGQWVDVG